MAFGWNYDDPTETENDDEGSNGAADSELVDDERIIPLQNSISNQVVLTKHNL